MSEVDIYGSDDYGGMSNGRFAFYFGYEATLCPHHGKDSHCNCEEREYCFTASMNGEEYARFTQAELDAAVSSHTRLRFEEPSTYILAGIGMVLRSEAS